MCRSVIEKKYLPIFAVELNSIHYYVFLYDILRVLRTLSVRIYVKSKTEDKIKKDLLKGGGSEY